MVQKLWGYYFVIFQYDRLRSIPHLGATKATGLILIACLDSHTRLLEHHININQAEMFGSGLTYQVGQS